MGAISWVGIRSANVWNSSSLIATVMLSASSEMLPDG